MKPRLLSRPLAMPLSLAMAPTALASTKWYVDGVNGNDSNNCKSPQTACKTIGHAIGLAHSGDSITVAAATYTENLTIGSSLKVIGASASTTIIDGGGVNTVVTISTSTAHVTLSKLTVRNGHAGVGAGISNSATVIVIDSTIRGNTAQIGGGIGNVGTLTINYSTISGNTATGPFFGGGIYNGGTLTINHSTISGNSARGYRGGGIGGGILNSRTLMIDSSTISGNSVDQRGGEGGGIFNLGNSGTVIISNSTISGNSAPSVGGILGAATLQNSIVANNSRGNCSGTMTSNGCNLSSDNTCNFKGTGDLNNTDPKLGQLGDYGGPTQTIPLLSGSPAIDAGNPSGCTDGHGHLLKTDQRGKPRPDHEDTGGCDMGAYERQKD